jgi:hypothetical protein
MSAVAPTGVAIACDLAEAAAQMVALRYRRDHPTATSDEVGAAVRRWWASERTASTVDSTGCLRLRPAI